MTLPLTSTGLGITAAITLTLIPWAGAAQTPATTVNSAWVSTHGGNMALLAAGGTTSGARNAADTRSSQGAGALVAELKAESGLTADQLGRLLGVTRRSIHNWAAGSPIAPKHEPRVRALSGLVFGLDATTPEGRRELMLGSNSGPSRFKSFLSSTPHSERIQHHIPVSERFEQ